MTPEFFFCVAGVYVCFLTWGITQERVSTTAYPPDGGSFKAFILLNLMQSIMAAALSLLYALLTSQTLKTNAKLSWKFLQVSVTNSLASPFGYMALKHIDYPTLILGKSCKLVPVMFMNWVLYRKTFPMYKYVVVGLITLGVSSFMLLHPQETGHKGSSTNSLWGLLLLGINLLMDGTTNSTQDTLFTRFNVSGVCMMFYMNLFSSGLMFLFLLIDPFGSSQLGVGVAFIQSHPLVLRDILVFSLTGGLGQLFIFYTLQRFGSLSLVTVTVTRKMFSILLSVFWFGHSINFAQWCVYFPPSSVTLVTHILKQDRCWCCLFRNRS